MQKANSVEQEYELICVIVNFGLGSKALKAARKIGVSGGTIMLARGTADNRWLRFFELTDIRKEIVLMVCERSSAALPWPRSIGWSSSRARGTASLSRCPWAGSSGLATMTMSSRSKMEGRRACTVQFLW